MICGQGFEGCNPLTCNGHLGLTPESEVWVDHDLPPMPRNYEDVPVVISDPAVQKLNTCVCGCPKSEHKLTRLSVPLLPRPDGPIYKLNGTVSDGLAFSPWVDQCSCGCTRYEEDD